MGFLVSSTRISSISPAGRERAPWAAERITCDGTPDWRISSIMRGISDPSALDAFGSNGDGARLVLGAQGRQGTTVLRNLHCAGVADGHFDLAAGMEAAFAGERARHRRLSIDGDRDPGILAGVELEGEAV